MDKLDSIRARLEAATPGPWRWDIDYGDIWSLEGKDNDVIRALDGAVYDEYDSDPATLSIEEKNMQFIAHAPEDIRYLLDEHIPALEAEVERLRAALEDIESAAEDRKFC